MRFVDEPNTQIAELMSGNKPLAVAGETMRVGYLQFDSSGSTGDHPLKNIKVRQALIAVNLKVAVKFLFVIQLRSAANLLMLPQKRVFRAYRNRNSEAMMGFMSVSKNMEWMKYSHNGE